MSWTARAPEGISPVVRNLIHRRTADPDRQHARHQRRYKRPHPRLPSHPTFRAGPRALIRRHSPLPTACWAATSARPVVTDLLTTAWTWLVLAAVGTACGPPVRSTRCDVGCADPRRRVVSIGHAGHRPGELRGLCPVERVAGHRRRGAASHTRPLGTAARLTSPSSTPSLRE